jgi:pimeloyl-ACP methyl ester carboxylesterase
VILARSTATKWPPDFPPQVSAALEQSWQEMQADLPRLSSKSTFIKAAEGGHFIHHDQPDLVMQAIRQLVDLTRSD